MAKKKQTERGGITVEPSAAEPMDTPYPNIIFIGSGEPPVTIQDGSTEILLPSAEEQKAGPFHHAEQVTICRLFPRLFKKYQKLSEV